MVTAIALTLLAGICRFFSAEFGYWNFVPMGAVSLYAGSRLPRRWAPLVPILAMVLSDLVIDYGTHRPLFELTRWAIYATFGATTLLGPIANRPRGGLWVLPCLSLTASAIFFATSNLATWAEGLLYPMTPAGLAQCYYAAIPFFGRTVVADLLGTGLLFGVARLFESVIERSTSPRLEPGRVD
jgi:hypothetical protein